MTNCIHCHHKPITRTIHLLMKYDKDMNIDDLRKHLKTEFPEQTKEFYESEIRSVEYVLRYWSGMRDEYNYPIPAWYAWQRNKMNIVKTETGLQFRFREE